MKKLFLALLLTTSVSIGWSSAAEAGGSNIPGGSLSIASYNSNHSGSVAGTCSLAVVDGILPINQGFVSSLTSTTKGKISTVCNTTSSSLTVKLVAGSAPSQAGYAETFKLDGGTGAYFTGLPNGFNSTTYTKNNISSGFSGIASNINVTARGAVAPSKLLAAGSYTIKVQATVTP